MDTGIQTAVSPAQFEVDLTSGSGAEGVPPNETTEKSDVVVGRAALVKTEAPTKVATVRPILRRPRMPSEVGSVSSVSVGGGSGKSASIVDSLLFDIYEKWHFRQSHHLGSESFTEYSTSEWFTSTADSMQIALEHEFGTKLTRTVLNNKGARELDSVVSSLKRHVAQVSSTLIRHLKRRDRRLATLQKNCDLVTAILQASSLKRSVDSRIRFMLSPQVGEDAFAQWKEGMRAVARLSGGIPNDFRKKVWLTLADNYITSLKIDWTKTRRVAFNERSNPDDDRLGLQIVKDLHRTGCSGFSGHDNEEERALLKRVLLAYARWNKQVGYCQGFNVLAALILEVVENVEEDALKVMIYVIDQVLPTSYFSNSLRALSVDMAVFRDLLKLHLPKLAKHLDHLQSTARDTTTGATYEPPLTNVFTMQWFLTLFATCLPKHTALRVWDLVLLDGSEILLRTGLAIWGKLQKRIMHASSADEFYTLMGTLTQELMDNTVISADQLVKTIHTMADFPFPHLSEMRERYTYNITPFSAAVSAAGSGARGRRRKWVPGGGAPSAYSDEEDVDEDVMMENLGCFSGVFSAAQLSPSRAKALNDSDRSSSSFDISRVSPGAYAANPETLGSVSPGAAGLERMSMDLNGLAQQYKKLRQRQKQARIIISAANARNHPQTVTKQPPASARHTTGSPRLHLPVPTMISPVESSAAVNHLYLGRHMLEKDQKLRNRKNTTVVEAPKIASMYGDADLMSPSGARPSDFVSSKDLADVRGEKLSSDSSGTVELPRVDSSGDSERQYTERSMSTGAKSTNSDGTTKGYSSDSSCCQSDNCGGHVESADDVFMASSKCAEDKASLGTDENMNKDVALEEDLSTLMCERESSSRKEIQTEEISLNISAVLQRPQAGSVQQHSDAALRQSNAETSQSIPTSAAVPLEGGEAAVGGGGDEQNSWGEEHSSSDSAKCVGSDGGAAPVTREVSPMSDVEITAAGNDEATSSDGSINDTQGNLQVQRELYSNSKPRKVSGLTEWKPARYQKHFGVSGKPSASSDPGYTPHDAESGDDAFDAPYPVSPLHPSQTKFSVHKQSPQAWDIRVKVPPPPPKTTRSKSYQESHSAFAAPAETAQSKKLFNPFPSRHRSDRRTQNGIKLGLYQADKVPTLETGMLSTGVQIGVGRQHIDACIHRQYMQAVKESMARQSFKR